jgi:aldehyde:ferredoxin oxidoreductase
MESGEIEWGNAEQVFEIIEEIRKGTEKGKLYGNGVQHLAENLGTNRIPTVKGQGISGYDPRVFKGMSITFATSPMGADHTAGAAIAGRKARQDKEYGELKENDHKLELSYELQVYTTVLDSMGCCYFVGPSYENMELIANVLNAMYGLELTREDVIDIGKHILRTEIQFNKKAGITEETNDVPEFFKKEPSEPTGLKFTFNKKDLKEFWNRLEQ